MHKCGEGRGVMCKGVLLKACICTVVLGPMVTKKCEGINW